MPRRWRGRSRDRVLLLKIRRPPRSPPFPYTTLFRSRLDPHRLLDLGLVELDAIAPGEARGAHHAARPRADRVRLRRSEEHTSELQSRQYLVCRLLLETNQPRSPPPPPVLPSPSFSSA